MLNREKENISIVVFGNRKDYFFTKICIASIRYFYPEVEIFMVKDLLNGYYSTKRLRRVYNVKLLKFDKKYFGWGASKIHFIMRKDMPHKRYLILDSDIIFLGRVLEQLAEKKADFVVAPEHLQPPFSQQQQHIYIDAEKVKKYFPDYEYPGFFFNTGQMIVTPGIIPEALMSPCFNISQYPYYKDWDTFKTVDQSILNSIIPVLMKRGRLTVDKISFMRWSVSYFDEAGEDNINKYLDGNTGLLLHYCGDVRTFDLHKMKGKNLLQFFKNQYLQQLSPFGRWVNSLQDSVCSYEPGLNFYKWCNGKYLKILQKIKSKNHL